MNKRVWLSFDLGIGGDYESLYEWLDSHEAVECGDNCASLLYPAKTDASKEIRASLKKAVTFRKKDRVYLIWRKPDRQIAGQFIIGGRRRAPWSGYAGVLDAGETDEGEA